MDAADGRLLRTPGEALGSAAEYAAGAGTHVRGGLIASVVGVQRAVPPPDGATDQARAAAAAAADAGSAAEASDCAELAWQRPVLEVVSSRRQSGVPTPGAVVTAKITRVNPRVASAQILCIGSQAVTDFFTGSIRQQDVRATEVDKLSLGDARAYYLSTAKNELGVVYAKSLAGGVMVPVSWQEMQCPITNQREPRKVAKSL
eukprot:SM000173S03007  [mRNA]  locus=s173:93895:95620:+ [translate_table: standard]